MPQKQLTIRDSNYEWIEKMIEQGEFNTATEAVNYCMRSQRQRELAKNGCEQ